MQRAFGLLPGLLGVGLDELGDAIDQGMGDAFATGSSRQLKSLALPGPPAWPL